MTTLDLQNKKTLMYEVPRLDELSLGNSDIVCGDSGHHFDEYEKSDEAGEEG